MFPPKMQTPARPSRRRAASQRGRTVPTKPGSRVAAAVTTSARHCPQAPTCHLVNLTNKTFAMPCAPSPVYSSAERARQVSEGAEVLDELLRRRSPGNARGREVDATAQLAR